MATTPWKSTLKELPTDGADCVIRVLNIYGELATVIYDDSLKSFYLRSLNYYIHVVFVARWKYA